MRFTFPSAAESVILFDTVDSAGGSISVDTANRTISGYVDHRGQKLYFSATVDKAIAASGTITGQGATSWIRFATTANEQVTLQIGTSLISVAQAAANLSQEVGAKSFDTVREEAAAQWDAALGKVRIEGATGDQLVTFYSNLYRAFMYPNNRSEMVGGVRKYQSPYDSAVHDGQMYVNNGFWDTARAVWPLYTLLAPTQDRRDARRVRQRVQERRLDAALVRAVERSTSWSAPTRTSPSPTPTSRACATSTTRRRTPRW